MKLNIPKLVNFLYFFVFYFSILNLLLSNNFIQK